MANLRSSDDEERVDVFAYGYATSFSHSLIIRIWFESHDCVFPIGDSLNEDDNDQDTLKEALLETNSYLLGLTIIISVFHSVFEFLAFKNGKA